MIRITDEPWRVMVEHAQRTYPTECCGAMLGRTLRASEAGSTVVGEGETDIREVVRAIPLENTYDGGQEDRYEIRPTDLLRVEREARAEGLTLLGIYHSHPDCGAYFSKTDLENSCPWYLFLVISIQKGVYAEANCFQPNADMTEAPPVPLELPASLTLTAKETV
ncbi:MAG: M67 family metallopeptidase [Bryobacterales bacterium]|jgi:proteasome lid subunit RPN8/RPN11|nr:M67 family metallopeptidase [Bryobacterales bacterium]